MSTLRVVNPADILPQPQAIDTSTVQGLRALWAGQFTALYPAYDVAMLESDPGAINAEALAFLMVATRKRVNDSYRALRLSMAKGPNLDGRAADLGLKRLVYLPATSTAPAVVEGDDDLLVRCWTTMQRWGRGGTNLGLEGAAQRLALPDATDVRVTDYPGEGRMRCVLLPAPGLDAAACAALLARVSQGLMRRDTRYGSVPCDTVLAEVLPLDLAVTLGVLPGASPEDAKAAARTAVATYLGRRRCIAGLVALSRLDAAACVANVPYAHWTGIAGDLLPGPDQAYALRSLTVLSEPADG